MLRHLSSNTLCYDLGVGSRAVVIFGGSNDTSRLSGVVPSTPALTTLLRHTKSTPRTSKLIRRRFQLPCHCFPVFVKLVDHCWCFSQEKRITCGWHGLHPRGSEGESCLLGESELAKLEGLLFFFPFRRAKCNLPVALYKAPQPSFVNQFLVAVDLIQGSVTKNSSTTRSNALPGLVDGRAL